MLESVNSDGMHDRVVIQSFDHRSLWAIRAIDPDIVLSALTLFEAPDLDELARQGADIWSPNFNVMTEPLVEQAHALGIAVIPWTVNGDADMLAVIDKGADGFITDRPDIAARLPTHPAGFA